MTVQQPSRIRNAASSLFVIICLGVNLNLLYNDSRMRRQAIRTKACDKRRLERTCGDLIENNALAPTFAKARSAAEFVAAGFANY